MSILDAMLCALNLTYEREEKCHNIYRDNTSKGYQDQEFNQCGNDS